MGTKVNLTSFRSVNIVWPGAFHQLSRNQTELAGWLGQGGVSCMPCISKKLHGLLPTCCRGASTAHLPSSLPGRAWPAPFTSSVLGSDGDHRAPSVLLAGPNRQVSGSV